MTDLEIANFLKNYQEPNGTIVQAFFQSLIQSSDMCPNQIASKILEQELGSYYDIFKSLKEASDTKSEVMMRIPFDITIE